MAASLASKSASSTRSESQHRCLLSPHRVRNGSVGLRSAWSGGARWGHVSTEGGSKGARLCLHRISADVSLGPAVARPGRASTLSDVTTRGDRPFPTPAWRPAGRREHAAQSAGCTQPIRRSGATLPAGGQGARRQIAVRRRDYVRRTLLVSRGEIVLPRMRLRGQAAPARRLRQRRPCEATRRGWFGARTLCLCKAQERRPTRILLVPRRAPDLTAVALGFNAGAAGVPVDAPSLRHLTGRVLRDTRCRHRRDKAPRGYPSKSG